MSARIGDSRDHGVKKLPDQFASQVDLASGDTTFDLTASTELVVAIAGEVQR